MPSPLDLVELPFLRDALVELVLLAVAGGCSGAWIVLRRLAFFSHAVGSATFPGLVAADATGISPTLAGAGGGARLRGRRRARAGAPAASRARPPRCCWWRRWRSGSCWPATCSSPARRWTACCSARCWGSTAADLALSGCAARWRGSPALALGPHLDGDRRSTPTARAALGLPAGRADFAPAGAGGAGRRGRHPGRGRAARDGASSSFPPPRRGCSPAACPG